MYQLTSSECVIRLADGAWIPPSPGNRAYGEYLQWLAEGNTPLAAEPVEAPPDYFAFWAALVQSGVYRSIRSQAASSLAMNTAATEFVALLGDAKIGRPLEEAIQASIEAVLMAGVFSAGDLAEFQAALNAGGLERIYSLTAA